MSFDVMSLDDPGWAQLQRGYRVPYDPRQALRALERDEDPDEAERRDFLSKAGWDQARDQHRPPYLPIADRDGPRLSSKRKGSFALAVLLPVLLMIVSATVRN